MPLTLTLNEEALKQALRRGTGRDELEFSLAVDGWQHAFRWKLDAGGGISAVPPSGTADVRTIFPVNGSAYALPKTVPPKEPADSTVPIRFEVDSENSTDQRTSRIKAGNCTGTSAADSQAGTCGI